MIIKINSEELKSLRERVKNQLSILLNEQEKRGLLGKIATVMYQSVMQNFKEEGTDRQKWAPLSPMTVALRRKGGGTGTPKILQDTGYLRFSIYPNIELTENTGFAIVSTNVPYARLHQYGGTTKVPARVILPKRKKVLRFVVEGKEVFAKYAKQPERTAKVPARPFLWIREQHKNKIINLCKSYLKK